MKLPPATLLAHPCVEAEVCGGLRTPATLLLSVGVTRDLFDGWASLGKVFAGGESFGTDSLPQNLSSLDATLPSIRWDNILYTLHALRV